MKKMLALVIALFIGIFIFSDVLFCQEKCDAPTWKVGDKWKWTPEPSGSETTGEVVDDTKDGFTLKLSSGTQIIYDKVTLNQKYIIESGRKNKSGRFPQEGVEFPFGGWQEMDGHD